MFLRSNGGTNFIQDTYQTVIVSSDTVSIFQGTVIVNLNYNDILDLALQSHESGTVELFTDTNAILTIRILNDLF